MDFQNSQGLLAVNEQELNKLVSLQTSKHFGNFFNASAELFNAKIKALRTTQRGVIDISLFLFRLAKIYA